MSKRLFIKYLDYLKTEKKITYAQMADEIGMHKDKLNNIRFDRQFYKDEYMDMLLKAYPYLKNIGTRPVKKNDKEYINYLLERIKELTNENQTLRGQNQQLIDAITGKVNTTTNEANKEENKTATKRE